MKLVRDTEKKEYKFTPFRVTLELESETEARLLWHIMNRSNLRDLVFLNNYGMSKYIMDMDGEFSGSDGKLRNLIEQHVPIETNDPRRGETNV